MENPFNVEKSVEKVENFDILHFVIPENSFQLTYFSIIPVFR